MARVEAGGGVRVPTERSSTGLLATPGDEVLRQPAQSLNLLRQVLLRSRSLAHREPLDGRAKRPDLGLERADQGPCESQLVPRRVGDDPRRRVGSGLRPPEVAVDRSRHLDHRLAQLPEPPAIPTMRPRRHDERIGAELLADLPQDVPHDRSFEALNVHRRTRLVRWR